MSNSRAYRRQVARQRLAQQDGRVIHLDACCQLELVLGPTRLDVRHDDGCAALRPHTPEGINARLQANQAVAAALTAMGVRTSAVIA